MTSKSLDETEHLTARHIALLHVDRVGHNHRDVDRAFLLFDSVDGPGEEEATLPE
jgi:hypothetical protein